MTVRDHPTCAVRDDALPVGRDVPQRCSRRRLRSTSSLMDALEIEQAILAGFDWGARTADIVAALWPERCKALVSVSGYLIGSQEAGKVPLPPQAELQWWYQYYFATERGRAGYEQVPARLREAHLADRVAEVELRRRHVRAERSVLRQPGSRRDRDPQLSLAAGAGRGRGEVRRPREAARRGSGHHRADDHARRGRQRCAASAPELPTPRSSRASTRTGPSRAASGTTFRRKLRKPLPRPSSTSTPTNVKETPCRTAPPSPSFSSTAPSPTLRAGTAWSSACRPPGWR